MRFSEPPLKESKDAAPAGIAYLDRPREETACDASNITLTKVLECTFREIQRLRDDLLTGANVFDVIDAHSESVAVILIFVLLSCLMYRHMLMRKT